MSLVGPQIAQAFHSVFLGKEGKEWSEAAMRIIIRKHLDLTEDKVQALLPLLPVMIRLNLHSSFGLADDTPE